MIVYVAGPIKGDTTYQNFYTKIIEIVEAESHTALAEMSGKFSTAFPLSDVQIYRRDIKWIDGSKIMIAEISGPSLGVGFEIAYAIFSRKIPVLAVVNKKVEKVSSMLSGCESKLLTIARYEDEDDLKKVIKNYISNLRTGK
jgi:nucleoside 2-deoxyribosyltransferase